MSNSPFLSAGTVDTIRDAAAALKAGHLVAFPTETVYGLGADARNPDSVRRIYELKGRPKDHPLIIHISSITQFEKWATEVPEYASSLAQAFWPGPITLILKRTDIVEDFITGGRNTVGLRVPNNPIALSLIQEFEKISDSAIAAPSANRFGQVSPTSSDDVREELGDLLAASDFILDGGKSIIGIESTIVDCSGNYPIILRSGFVSEEDIKTKLNIPYVSYMRNKDVNFSGSFEKHYAPRCQVILDSEIIVGAGFLALTEIETPIGLVRLASPDSVIEFAHMLYSTFRVADRLGLNALVVCPPIGGGLAVAINERLIKAAQGR